LLKTFLYHFSQGISAFLVMDNLSTDSTLSILYRLSRIIPVVIYHQNDDTHDQSRWVTGMARDAYLNEGLTGLSIMMLMNLGSSLGEMLLSF
jgi:hypothetical protein|tara:strand:+ start:936 stop:1211 length:276 start_codon:yes stop_codon:yes gene_type:complete